jgi:hypothetical protein
MHCFEDTIEILLAIAFFPTEHGGIRGRMVAWFRRVLGLVILDTIFLLFIQAFRKNLVAPGVLLLPFRTANRTLTRNVCGLY